MLDQVLVCWIRYWCVGSGTGVLDQVLVCWIRYWCVGSGTGVQLQPCWTPVFSLRVEEVWLVQSTGDGGDGDQQPQPGSDRTRFCRDQSHNACQLMF